MRTLYTTAFVMLTGAAIGALAVQGLRAQTKPPAYVVTETEITDLDTYQKEYVPLAQASIKAAGGHLLGEICVRRNTTENARRYQSV